MTEPVPPISTQVSRLAQLAPDEAAITCEGRTITRGELDASTNRLARAYAELGVGVGDYVTMVLPNSIEFLLAAIAAWKLGAVPQPLPTRLPDAEFEGLLDLRPRALLVGRSDPRGDIPSVPTGFTPDPGLSDTALPEAVSPSWKVMASGGSTGRPKLIESGGDSRYDAVSFGQGLGRPSGRHDARFGADVAQHWNDRGNRRVAARASRCDAAVRSGRVPATGDRAPD